MTEPAPVQSALTGACPRCGKGKMFAGIVRFADRCGSCGLDFSRFNVGDGPVVFLTMGVGGLVTLLAILVELNWEPGLLVHALLWIPVTTILVVGALRFAKGLLLTLEYRNAAEEGRLKQEP
ncbi:DUF983 domain-containing protein [Sphingomonas canadensis]|uniref:DUF983 domain-containing protein n=1 Tax=Sphingomonas canadensis TaxID=1219257 RepID=A0ABW3H7S0_9SPHN|nr:DUF983 domain-containing protein [Sphingomonas canadensis]MCW3837214.1 DUF983 domain-containing protein [Sphingomonas canadensis]